MAFEGLISYLSNFHTKDVKTTGFVFKLTTRVTVNILLGCAFLIGINKLFGDPIECLTDKGTPKYALELSCWMNGTFLYRELLNHTIGATVISPGVGSHRDNYHKITQSYYQWIVPVILLQAMLLYTPRLLWHVWENDTLSKITQKADSPIINDEWSGKKNQILRFLNEVSCKSHRFYAIKYYTCEVLAFGALILNVYIMQLVYNSFWIQYKPAISALIHGDFYKFKWNAAILFPTAAKCDFHAFGPGGSVMRYDGLCFLPQNVINEKIFAFFYFWFIIMLTLSVINMFFAATMLLMRCMRIRDIKRMFDDGHFPHNDIKYMTNNADFGIWHMIKLLKKNLSPILFQDLMTDFICNKPHKKTDEDHYRGEFLNGLPAKEI